MPDASRIAAGLSEGQKDAPLGLEVRAILERGEG